MSNQQYVLERYDLDINMPFDEFDKKYPRCFKSSSFGCDYPQIAIDKGEDTLWIDFEHDLSKIRYIERSNKFNQRYVVYQRHWYARFWI